MILGGEGAGPSSAAADNADCSAMEIDATAACSNDALGISGVDTACTLSGKCSALSPAAAAPKFASFTQQTSAAEKQDLKLVRGADVNIVPSPSKPVCADA